MSDDRVTPLSLEDQLAFLASELAEEKRSTMRMAFKFFDLLADFEIDPRLIAVLESWVASQQLDPVEWRGYLAARPLKEPIDRGLQVLELFAQLRAVATVTDDVALEQLLGRIEALYLIDPSTLLELDQTAERLVAQVSQDLAEDRDNAEA